MSCVKNCVTKLHNLMCLPNKNLTSIDKVGPRTEGIKSYNSQPATEGYRVTMVQIFVTSNLSIQICSLDTRDELPTNLNCS